MNSGPEMTQAVESTTMVEVLAWLEVNKKRLAIGAGILLALALVAYVWNYARDQRELRSNDALLALNVSFNAPTNLPPATSGDLLKVAREFQGTKAAERASFLAASALFAEGKFAEAQSQFEKFQTEVPGSRFNPSAAIGAAVAVESQGRTAEALTAYQSIATRYPNSSVLTQAKFAMARLHEEKKQLAEAYKLYEEVAKPGTFSTWADQAAQRKEQLSLKHPELGKTNAPPAIKPPPLVETPPPAGAPPSIKK